MSLGLVDALARHLAGAGIGLTYDPSGAAMAAAWSVFPGGLPQTPDQAVSLTEYAIVEADPGEPWTTVRIQARVRGTSDYRVAKGKAGELFGALVGLGSIQLFGGLWLQLVTSVQAGPVDIGPDVAGRHETVINFEVEYRDPTTHRP